jgi:hypothetical protein
MFLTQEGLIVGLVVVVGTLLVGVVISVFRPKSRRQSTPLPLIRQRRETRFHEISQ